MRKGRPLFHLRTRQDGMETNNDTWMTHGKHGNDRGDWPLSIVVFEDDPYHFRLLQHHLTAMNPNHEIMGPLTTTEAGKAFFSYHQDVDLIIADISRTGVRRARLRTRRHPRNLHHGPQGLCPRGLPPQQPLLSAETHQRTRLGKGDKEDHAADKKRQARLGKRHAGTWHLRHPAPPRLPREDGDRRATRIRANVAIRGL